MQHKKLVSVHKNALHFRMDHCAVIPSSSHNKATKRGPEMQILVPEICPEIRARNGSLKGFEKCPLFLVPHLPLLTFNRRHDRAHFGDQKQAHFSVSILALLFAHFFVFFLAPNEVPLETFQETPYINQGAQALGLNCNQQHGSPGSTTYRLLSSGQRLRFITAEMLCCP